jgi:hypothetical protein
MPKCDLCFVDDAPRGYGAAVQALNLAWGWLRCEEKVWRMTCWIFGGTIRVSDVG